MIFTVEWDGYQGLETREKVKDILKFKSKLRDYIDKRGGKTKTTFMKKYPEAACIYVKEK